MYKALKLDSNGYLKVNNEIGGNYHKTKDKLPNFEDYAKEELETLEAKERSQKIIVIYRSCGYTYHNFCEETDKILQLSLSPQCNICNPMLQRITPCNKTAIYYKDNKGRYKQLWKTGTLREDKGAIFLYPEKLSKTLKNIFTNCKLTLGRLTKGNMHYIAWEINSDEGIYYLLWHNACLCKSKDDLTFTPQSITELKRTYKALSFTVSHESSKDYKTLFA